MRIDYKGQSGRNLTDRVGVISNVKENEIEQLERHLRGHNLGYSTFGDYYNGMCTYNIYVSVDDRDDFEELKDLYIEFKSFMKRGKSNKICINCHSQYDGEIETCLNCDGKDIVNYMDLLG